MVRNKKYSDTGNIVNFDSPGAASLTSQKVHRIEPIHHAATLKLPPRIWFVATNDESNQEFKS